MPDEWVKPDLMVPRMLYGPQRGKARSAWRRIAKLAAKSGSWEVALKDVEFMPIDEVHGDFSIQLSNGLLFIGDNLWLDIVVDILVDQCTNVPGLKYPPGAEPEWSVLFTNLILSGLDQFWFALSLCVTGGWMVLNRTPARKREVAMAGLPKLLRWWPILCEFDLRFSAGQHAAHDNCRSILRGWPRWCGGLAGFCGDLGINDPEGEKILVPDPVEAGKIASQWLAECQRGER